MKYHRSKGRHARRDNPITDPNLTTIDPDDFFGDPRHDKPDYKTQQLCKQVMRAVSYALTGICADPVLQSLQMESVIPAPNAGHLLITVVARTTDEGLTAADILTRLENVKGLLRAEVAGTVVRKRAPELSFFVLQTGSIQ